MKYYVASYLKKASPQRLDNLRTAHPLAGDVFSVDMEFGDNGGAATRTAPARAAKIGLIRQSAEQLLPDIEGLIQSVRSRSTLVGRLRLGGGLVAAVSGAVGVIAALVGNQLAWSEDGIALVSAVVATAGGLLVTFADHFERSEIGTRYSPIETLPKLVNSNAAATRALQALDRDAIFPLSDSSIQSIIAELDGAAEEVMRLKYLAV